MTTAQIAIVPKLIPVFAGEADVRGAHGGRGSGKCLGRGTLLLRADASLVAVENVKDGDQLLGPDGMPRTVIGTTKGVGPLYRVTQTTGMTYVCNDAHILVLERSESSRKDFGTFSKAGNPQRKNGRYGGFDTGLGYSLITAAEYAKQTERFKAQHFGFRRAVVGEHRALPVEPYMLGLWLGDGSSKAPEITNVDPEIVAYLEEVAAASGWTICQSKDKAKAPRYYIGSAFQRGGSLVQQLRKAGVFRQKHIPEVYFGASTEQRLSLLAGLIDTDGHVANGCVEITQASEVMIDGIIRLAHGLGFKASKVLKLVMCNGRECPSFRCMIGGDIGRLPLLIERKKRGASALSKNKDWRRTRIDVEPIGEGEYFGFELDGDHLFLLADGTVTHNTRSFAKMSAVRAYAFAKEGIEGVVLCGRQYQNSLADSSFAEVKAAIAEEPWLAAHFDLGETYIKTKDGRVRYVFAGLDRNIDSIKSTARILLAWVDEAESVTESAWQILIPTLREEGEHWHAELWVTWNPKRKGSATDKRFRQQATARMKIVEVNWRDNPRFPAKLDRERREDMEMRPGSYPHVWEGDYLRVVEGAYFASYILKAREEGRIGVVPADPIMRKRAFVDIGGTGAKADAFAIWIAQFVGLQIRVLDYYEAVGQPVSAHLQWLANRGHTSKTTDIWLPHDGDTQDKVYDVSYASALREAGYTVTVVPNQGKGAAMARIQEARRLWPSIWIHEPTCGPGLEALAWYQEKRDDERGIGLGPMHDWSSNGADAFGLMCVAHEPPTATWGAPINYPGLGRIA